MLQDWASVQPRRVGSKTAERIVRDYWASALVLAAKFRFRPVLGQRYHLYGDDAGWSLSLVSPVEWGNRAPGDFVAYCSLRSDMTWELEFSPALAHSPAAERLARFIEGFAESLAGQESLVDGLPFYVGHLPYYQRLLATGLAVSLRHSIGDTGEAALQRVLPALLPGGQRAGARDRTDRVFSFRSARGVSGLDPTLSLKQAGRDFQ